jgi:hypothetical protein
MGVVIEDHPRAPEIGIDVEGGMAVRKAVEGHKGQVLASTCPLSFIKYVYLNMLLLTNSNQLIIYCSLSYSYFQKNYHEASRHPLSHF